MRDGTGSIYVLRVDGVTLKVGKDYAIQEQGREKGGRLS